MEGFLEDAEKFCLMEAQMRNSLFMRAGHYRLLAHNLAASWGLAPMIYWLYSINHS